MEILLALNLSIMTEYVLPILMFIVGLGLVVFVHELGHFTVAKLADIKVEQFALGFGKRLLSFRIGETDYRINLVPLGGYVKMLGQEDFKPLKENDKPDPRAFDQKSVGVRLAVVSAGVVMNIILAGILFMIVGMVGKQFPAAVVGSVAPGSPAQQASIIWNDTLDGQASTGPAVMAAPNGAAQSSPWGARLQSGDRITRMEGESIILGMNDYRIDNLQEVAMAAALSSDTDRYKLTIERTRGGVTRTGTAAVGVKSQDGMLMIGIGGAVDLVVAQAEEMQVDIAPFQKDDRIIEVNGQVVENVGDIQRLSIGAGPVTFTVLRDGKQVDLAAQPTLSPAEDVVFRQDGRILRGDMEVTEGTLSVQQNGQVTTMPVTDIMKEPLVLLGMSPRIKIVSVVDTSPADRTGLKPGDVILSYGDRTAPTLSQVHKTSSENARNGTEIQVLRDGLAMEPIHIVPATKKDKPQLGFTPGTDQQNLIVASVAPGSVADKAGIESGSEILQVNGTQVKTWLDLYEQIKAASGKDLAITHRVRNVQKTATIPALQADEFDASAYSLAALPTMLPLKPLTVQVRKENPLDAIAWGGKETVKLVLASYISIRSLVLGYASPKQAAGPVGIGAMAVTVGRRSFVDFVYFIAFISAAVAVFNFLPLPVVDGGLAVLLIIEKVRGKPLPVRVVNIIQTVGIILLLGIFLAVTFNDIRRIGEGMW